MSKKFRSPSGAFEPDDMETGTVGGFNVHRLFATFTDPKREAAFDKRLFDVMHSKETPPNVLSALLIYVVLGLLDYEVVPRVFEYAAILRYGVMVPIILTLWIISRTEMLRGIRPAVPAVISWTGSAHFLAVGLAAGGSEGILYQFFSVLLVLLPPLIGRSTVKEAFWIGLGCFATLNISMLIHGDPHPTVWLFLAATYLVCWGYSVYGAWMYHMGAHHDFWQGRIIEWQMAELNVERQESERLLLNVLPRSIAGRLKGGEEQIADSYESVSVLFADISGFTMYASKVTPEQLVTRLNSIFTAFDDMIEVHGLEKIKTIGDAYMIAGGLPEPCDDHAERMARFGLGMLGVIDDVNAETGEAFAMRIGIHSGPVVAGVIGKVKFAYDLWGDTVNIASRMESHGESSRIQLSESTAALLGDTFETEERGLIEVKGKGEMKTFWLLGEVTKSPPNQHARDIESQADEAAATRGTL